MTATHNTLTESTTQKTTFNSLLTHYFQITFNNFKPLYTLRFHAGGQSIVRGNSFLHKPSAAVAAKRLIIVMPNLSVRDLPYLLFDSGRFLVACASLGMTAGRGPPLGVCALTRVLPKEPLCSAAARRLIIVIQSGTDERSGSRDCLQAMPRKEEEDRRSTFEV